MRIIGISGPARAGKDTVANLLSDNLPSYWGRGAFAEPLKSMLEVMGVDCSDGLKATPHPLYGRTPRHMMQTLGTEWGRQCIAPDVWTKAFKHKYSGRAVIVSDVRMANEADLVRQYGLLIHVQGRGGIPGNHASEAGVGVANGDMVLNNTGSLDDLVISVKHLAQAPEIRAAPIYKLNPTIRRFDVVSLPGPLSGTCPYGGVGDIVEALPGKYLKINKVGSYNGEWVLHLSSPAHD